MGFLSRLFERFGLVADTEARGNADEFIPVAPRVDQFVPAARAERIANGEEPCPHLRETPLLPTEDTRDKFYRCDDCGLVYRHMLVDGKPWLIRGYQPVGMQP